MVENEIAKTWISAGWFRVVCRLKIDDNDPAAVVVGKIDDNTSIATTNTVSLFLIFMYSIFLLALILLLF